MWERFQENWRIPAAILFSAVLVIGAYIFAKGIESPMVAQASEETALLQAIASKDSDIDGLPDWEESLYGTDSHNPDSFKLRMTDGEAVAKGLIVPKAIADISVATSTPADSTLTSAFAKTFFSLYLAAKQANNGADLTANQTSALADQAMNQLSQNFAPTADFKKMSDIKISGTGPDALLAFAMSAEAVLRNNATEATMSDIEYLQAAVQGDDATATTYLATLAKAYRNSAVGLAALSVPAELAAAHLAIVNSLMRLSEIYNDFARVDTDPLASMLALEQYTQTELAAEQAFRALASAYVAAGVILPAGTPGASFVNLMADITARQQAAPNTL